MKKYLFPLFPLVFVFFISCRNQKEKQADLISGNIADNWTLVANPGCFVPGEGTLICRGEGGEMVYNASRDFRNFELDAELKTEKGGSVALLFHTLEGRPERGYKIMIGNSLPVLTEKGWRVRTGSLYGIRSVYYPMVNDGEWFRLSVKVAENHIETFINGIKVVDYIQPDNPWRSESGKERLVGSGTFAIQTFSGEITFKSIVVRRLPDTARLAPVVEPAWDSVVTRLADEGFPLIDFHVHLKGGLTLDQAIENSRRLGINYGIAPNCGLRFPVTDDISLSAYLDSVKGKPIFRGMQAEGREWITLFSPEAISKFDYVFTDAMTFTDYKGRRSRIWIPEEVWVDDKQQFMDQLTGKIESILSQEPVDIYVNPTVLPAVLMPEYDQLWTDDRVDRIIRVLADNQVALEINARYKVPGAVIIRKAKEAGVKFTFGTNNTGADTGRLEYCLEMIRSCGLTPADMAMPEEHSRKPVLVKGLPAKITG